MAYITSKGEFNFPLLFNNSIADFGIDPNGDFSQWIETVLSTFYSWKAILTEEEMEIPSDYIFLTAFKKWCGVGVSQSTIMTTFQSMRDKKGKALFDRDELKNWELLNYPDILGGVIDVVVPSIFEDISINQGQRWFNTSIHLPETHNVLIQYVTGEWSADILNGSYDADGHKDLPGKEGYPVPDANEGALVGRFIRDNINYGDPFLIGNSYIKAKGDYGILELTINDDVNGKYGEGYLNNEGSITISLEASLDGL